MGDRRGPRSAEVITPRARASMRYKVGIVDAPAAGLVMAFAAFVGWFFLNDAGPSARTTVADLAYPVFGFGVAALASAACRRSTSNRPKLGWALFAAAMVSRGLADLAWFWLETVQHSQPFPSVADIGYISSYLLVFLAVWTLGAPRRRLDRRSLALDLTTVAVGAFILIWYLLIDEISGNGDPLLQQVLAIGYPVGDALLLTVAAALLLRRPDWLSTQALALLTTGLVLWAAADIAWTSLSLGGNYVGGDWLDVVWLGAMVVWGLAADVSARDSSPPARPLPMFRVEQLVPFAGLAMGYGVLLTRLGDPQIGSIAVAVVGSLILSLVVVTRQSAVKREHESLLERYYELASVDPLTGLFRREMLIEHAERELVRAHASHTSLALLMIDVDRFKQVNDTFGHAAGDAVLMTVSRLCRELRRNDDVIGRFGGDELIALLPATDEPTALVVARRLIESIASAPTFIEGVLVPVTLSIGAAVTGGDEPLIALFARADDALYRAKASGRNIAVGYQPPDLRTSK